MKKDIEMNPKANNSHPSTNEALLNLRDQIRTSVCITPPRLLAHDAINYGVPICAFYGNVTPRRSKHKLCLE
jgi:hypothetical protein